MRRLSLLKTALGMMLMALLVLADTAMAQRASFKEGEVLVKMKPGMTMAAETPEQEASAVASRFKAEKARKLKSRHVNPDLYLLKLKAGENVEDKVLELMSDPDVEYAQPNHVFYATATPDDPRFGELWGLARMALPSAWDVTTGSSGVIVAVIDTGVDYNHPDLKANLWHSPFETPGNGSDDDNNGYVDDVYGINAITGSGNPYDDNGHGTHVSGTIGAAGNNAAGVTGVNWTTRIMALKFLDSTGSGYDSDAIECINYAVAIKQAGENVRVINASWGGTPNGGDDPALETAIKTAGDNDVLFVAAAGNDGNNNDTRPVYPASSTAPNIISVAATTGSDTLASFSNYGASTVDIAAPGQDILSTVPGGGYAYMSGTSMATPHITGLAALILSQDQGLSATQVKNSIIATADVTSPALPVLAKGRASAANAIKSSGAELILDVSQDGAYTIMSAAFNFGGQPQYGAKITFYQDGAPVGSATTGLAASTAPGTAKVTVKALLGSHTGYAVSAAQAGMPVVWSAPVSYTTNKPAIDMVYPSSSGPGTNVNLFGTNFGSRKGSVKMTYGTTTSSVKPYAWTDDTISFKVPGKKAGNYTITVVNGLGASAGAPFTIPLPAISSLSNTNPAVGEVVYINGSGFGTIPGSVSLLQKNTTRPVAVKPMTWANSLIQIVTPPKPLGDYSITVKNKAGTSPSTGQMHISR